MGDNDGWNDGEQYLNTKKETRISVTEKDIVVEAKHIYLNSWFLAQIYPPRLSNRWCKSKHRNCRRWTNLATHSNFAHVVGGNGETMSINYVCFKQEKSSGRWKTLFRSSRVEGWQDETLTTVSTTARSCTGRFVCSKSKSTLPQNVGFPGGRGGEKRWKREKRERE